METKDQKQAIYPKNGFLFRWWNHLKCSAVYGHRYKKDGEDAFGHVGCTCMICGKNKVF